MSETNWYSRLESLEVLADIDESANYEVDMAAIGMDKETGKFILLTASGCSCWDGEAEEEQFNSLDALAAALIGNDDRRWNPSLNGAKELINKARGNYANNASNQ